MARVNVNMKLTSFRLREALPEIGLAMSDSGRSAATIIRDTVRSYAPFWRGGLRRSIRLENRGPDGFDVTAKGVVAWVHEKNATWSRMPPIQPLKRWASSKLGDPDAAYPVRWKIFKYGLTLPNKEGKGQMFARTRREFTARHRHFDEFVKFMRRRLGQIRRFEVV